VCVCACLGACVHARVRVCVFFMKSFCFMSSLYLEGVYGDSKMGVSCLVTSEDVTIKINLFSHHICILVPMILFPHMPLWPAQG